MRLRTASSFKQVIKGGALIGRHGRKLGVGCGALATRLGCEASVRHNQPRPHTAGKGGGEGQAAVEHVLERDGVLLGCKGWKM